MVVIVMSDDNIYLPGYLIETTLQMLCPVEYQCPKTTKVSSVQHVSILTYATVTFTLLFGDVMKYVVISLN